MTAGRDALCGVHPRARGAGRAATRSGCGGWRSRRARTRARVRSRRRRIRPRRVSSGGRRRARRPRSCWPRRAPSARRAGSRVIAARAASSRRRIRSMRSSSTTRTPAVAAATSSAAMSAGRAAGSVATRCASCRRSACCWSSIARIGCAARAAGRDHRPVAGRDRRLGVRAAAAGGGGDVDRAQPDLAPRRQPSWPASCSAPRSRPAASTRSASTPATRSTGPHARLRDWILGQDALHVDETGWRTAGDSRALWAATSPTRRCLRSPSTATASSSTS